MTSSAAISESDELRAAYKFVWDEVTRQQAAIIDDPRRAAQRSRLLRFQRYVERQMDALDGKAASWVLDSYPGIYEAGATAAQLGPFTWTGIHEAAFERHAVDLYTDLLEATRYVRRDTKRFIREAARLRSLLATATDTATRQAEFLARDLAANGIHAVTYRNGARHGLDTYTEMAIRTKTAAAYNEGTVNQAGERGVVYFEVFDGPGCGWTFHEDTEQALGKIVTKDEALAFPYSHPNCRRGFGPRPDLLSPKDARAASSSVTPSQTAAQRAADAQRAAARRSRRLRRLGVRAR